MIRRLVLWTRIAFNVSILMAITATIGGVLIVAAMAAGLIVLQLFIMLNAKELWIIMSGIVAVLFLYAILETIRYRRNNKRIQFDVKL